MRFITFILLTFCVQAHADHHLSIEYRAELPIENDDQELANGFQVQYGNTLYRSIDYYLAWGLSRFDYSGISNHVEKTGYAIGISSEYPFLSSLISGYIGLTYKHYEVELSSEFVQEGSHELGFELGALLIKPISPSWDVYGRVGYEDSSSKKEDEKLYGIDIDEQLITSLGVRYNF